MSTKSFAGAMSATVRGARRFAELTLVFAVLIGTHGRARAQTVHDSRFTYEVITRGAGMTAIAFAPDGRMYVAQKRGVILTLAPNGSGGYGAPQTFLDLRSETLSGVESGLLGLALDPSFSSNRFMYVYQVRASDTRILRITVGATGTSAASQFELLAGLPRAVEHHKAGKVAFAPNDPNALYVAVGDDGDPATSQLLDRYEGKVLRINKADGQGLPDNPFYSGSTTTVRSRIWAYGLRNPFRFAFSPSGTPSDALYLSENGDANDRISRVRRGSNGSWTGNESTFLSPTDVNHKVLDTQAPTLTGITVVVGGAFADPANPNSTTLLVSNGGYGHTGSPMIARYRLTGTSLDGLASIPQGEPFVSGLSFAGGVDLTIGPDGALYFVTCTAGSAEGEYELSRIRLAAGATPDARFTSSSLRGPAPLDVSFTDASVDGDNDIVSWHWSFGDGTTSTLRNPTHRYAANGRYTLTFTVTDAQGHSDFTTATVEVVRTVTLRISGRVFNGRDLKGRGLSKATQLRLYDGDTGAQALLANGTNIINVPAGGSFSAQGVVAVNGNHLVISAGEPTTDGVWPAYTALAIPAGGTIDRSSLNFWLSNTAISGRVRDTRGRPAIIDIGVKSTSGAPYAIAGGRDVLTGTPTGVAHRVVSDVLGYYYIPLRNTSAKTFVFDMLRDTGVSQYTADTFSRSIASAEGVTRDITVGLINGGRSCSDLSGIAVTPNIDYARDIQPIFNAQCTGCHTATAPNVGGLDLRSGASYGELVNVPSAFVPGMKLVAPGVPSRSFLFEKINCADPQHGTRMRPTDAMSLTEQAKIRDFITQTSGP